MTFSHAAHACHGAPGSGARRVAWCPGWSPALWRAQPGLILADNYRSVLAAQRMKEAVERADQSVLLELLGQPKDAAGV